MRILIISLIIAFLSQFTRAQVPRVGDPEYTAQGRLLILRVVPKDRTADLFVAGHEAVRLDLKNEAKILSVSLLSGGKKRVLELAPKGESYEIKDLPRPGSQYELLFQTETRGVSEEIHVKISPRKP